jgi:hypothetical protein
MPMHHSPPCMHAHLSLDQKSTVYNALPRHVTHHWATSVALVLSACKVPAALIKCGHGLLLSVPCRHLCKARMGTRVTVDAYPCTQGPCRSCLGAIDQIRMAFSHQALSCGTITTRGHHRVHENHLNAWQLLRIDVLMSHTHERVFNLLELSPTTFYPARMHITCDEARKHAHTNSHPVLFGSPPHVYRSTDGSLGARSAAFRLGACVPNAGGWRRRHRSCTNHSNGKRRMDCSV